MGLGAIEPVLGLIVILAMADLFLFVIHFGFLCSTSLLSHLSVCIACEEAG